MRYEILKFTTKKLFKQMRLIYQNTCFPANKTNLYTCEVHNGLGCTDTHTNTRAQQNFAWMKRLIRSKREKRFGVMPRIGCNICAEKGEENNSEHLYISITYICLPKITSFAYFYPFSISLSIFKNTEFLSQSEFLQNAFELVINVCNRRYFVSSHQKMVMLAR